MTVLDYAYELFVDIKEKKSSFSMTINKKINQLGIGQLDAGIVKDTLKSVINRYYFLLNEVTHLIEDENELDLDYLVLALGMSRYARNTVVSDIVKFIKESKHAEEFTFDVAKVEEMLNSISKTPTPIPAKYEKNFVKKIALLYSYPDWIVGMMNKHFGKKNAFKTISDSRKGAPINICQNTLVMEEELPNDKFNKTGLASGSYEYISKEPLVDNELFKTKKIFVMDQMEQVIADKMDAQQGEEILVIGGNHNHLASLLAIKAYDLVRISYAASNDDNVLSSKKIANQLNVKSVKPFICNDVDMVITHVPAESFDKVLVTPPNSELGLIRQKPEILITFKQDELDGLIENQKRYIKEAARFVKKGAMFIYSVPTLNKKESVNIVGEFLEENKEFELVEDCLVFPYVHKTSGVYYAIMKRKIEEE